MTAEENVVPPNVESVAVEAEHAYAPKLTDRQAQVLAFIHSYIAAHNFAPTMREIGKHMGIRSTNGVNDHLRALERKGVLRRQIMKSRSLVPVSVDTETLSASRNGLVVNLRGDVDKHRELLRRTMVAGYALPKLTPAMSMVLADIAEALKERPL